MKHSHRSPGDVLRELRLPGPERRAAKAEREAEARMRAERDSPRTAEKLAARNQAESQRYRNFWPG